MRPIHVLVSQAERRSLLHLLEQCSDRGVRVGWLELVAELASDDLVDATSAGAMRSVRLSDRGALSLKARSGMPPIVDVLREHFLGCRAVILSRAAGTPVPWPDLSSRAEVARVVRLEPAAAADGSWVLSPIEGGDVGDCAARRSSTCSSAELAVRLARPYLFPSQ